MKKSRCLLWAGKYGTFFWDMATCWLVSFYWCCRGACCSWRAWVAQSLWQLATGWMVQVLNPERLETFSATKLSIPALGPTKSPIQRVLGSFSRSKVAGMWSWPLTSISMNIASSSETNYDHIPDSVVFIKNSLKIKSCMDLSKLKHLTCILNILKKFLYFVDCASCYKLLLITNLTYFFTYLFISSGQEGTAVPSWPAYQVVTYTD